MKIFILSFCHLMIQQLFLLLVSTSIGILKAAAIQIILLLLEGGDNLILFQCNISLSRPFSEKSRDIFTDSWWLHTFLCRLLTCLNEWFYLKNVFKFSLIRISLSLSQIRSSKSFSIFLNSRKMENYLLRYCSLPRGTFWTIVCALVSR